MTLLLTAYSFYTIFTQVPKTFNSTVALQVGFLKRLRDIGTLGNIGAEVGGKLGGLTSERLAGLISDRPANLICEQPAGSR